jgi:RNA polymerase sigma-70 factor (ECF subfamily)
VLTLRFVDDLSLAEIAAALQVPLGTVKSRLHLAIKDLREDPRTKEFFGP